MNNKTVEVMECTLRDGSYTIDFQFTKEDTHQLVAALADAGMKWIEVGHGVGLGANKGSMKAAASDEDYAIAAVEAAKGKARVGAFFIPGIGTEAQLRESRKLGLDFIRIGINASEVDQAVNSIHVAKEIGFIVSANLMKSYVFSPFDVCRASKKAVEAGADLVSLVDSAGGMFPDDVSTYIRAMVETIGNKVGFHGHNNLGLANACSIAALQSGATMIDSTLQGMGRSTGNAWTESMLFIYEKLGYETGIDSFKVMDIGEKLIRPRLGQGGFSAIEVTAGYALFHSSFMKYVDEAAKTFDVDPRSVIIEVSKINKNNPSSELFMQAGARLAQSRKPRHVSYPTIVAERAK